MRNVYLHGHLKKAFGASFRFAVDTPGQAIRLLNVNFPGFQRALRQGHYRLIVGDRKTGQRLSLDEVEMNLGRADFHLVPVAAGSRGKGGALKTILGVALVGAAIFFSGGTLAAPLAGLSSTAFSIGGLGVSFGNIAGIGLMAGLMGISQMIAPTQKTDTGTDKQDSFALSGPTNNPEQGFPVPVGIGEAIVGGIPVSVGYDVVDIPVGV